jgi:hypothetical protein
MDRTSCVFGVPGIARWYVSSGRFSGAGFFRRGLAVRPAEAAARVNVTARCAGNPEKVIVTNNTRHRIKVRRLTSIYQPRSNEPFRVDRTLRRGRSITFESGPAANRNFLTRQYVFNSDVGTREGARVATSVGRFADRCG